MIWAMHHHKAATETATLWIMPSMCVIVINMLVYEQTKKIKTTLIVDGVLSAIVGAMYLFITYGSTLVHNIAGWFVVFFIMVVCPIGIIASSIADKERMTKKVFVEAAKEQIPTDDTPYEDKAE